MLAAAVSVPLACSAGELLGPDIETSAIGSRQAMEAQRARQNATPTEDARLRAALQAATQQRRELLLNGAEVPLELELRIQQLKQEVLPRNPYGAGDASRFR